MRRANTTFVNLRAALNDVDPLVDASKPVAKRLGPFLSQARAFAADAEPAVRDLRRTIRRRGRSNDLIEFIKSVPPLADIAVETRSRTVAPGGRNVSVGQTRGAFPESAEAFLKAAPEIGLARPYATDFLGWFDDFSTTGGGFDALGATARAHINLSENIPTPGASTPVPRDTTPGFPARWFQFKRCPGSAEDRAVDGSNVLSEAEQEALQCEESARATGPVR
jgi:phospholipid/cholesterol/gamma-HCH transport system substrate-binding protein